MKKVFILLAFCALVTQVAVAENKNQDESIQGKLVRHVDLRYPDNRESSVDNYNFILIGPNVLYLRAEKKDQTQLRGYRCSMTAGVGMLTIDQQLAKNLKNTASKVVIVVYKDDSHSYLYVDRN